MDTELANKIVIIDWQTGQVVEREMTPEELAAAQPIDTQETTPK